MTNGLKIQKIVLLMCLLCASCATIPDRAYHKENNFYKNDKIYYFSNGWRTYHDGFTQDESGERFRLSNPPPYTVMEYSEGDAQNNIPPKAWHANQVQNAIDKLKLSEPNTYLFVYIHGWNNNAFDCFKREKDGSLTEDIYEQCELARSNDKDDLNKFYGTNDLAVFQTLLYKRQIEMQRAGIGNIKVKGIYIGWYGRSSTRQLDRLMTVHKSAKVAINIGENSSLGEDLKRFSQIIDTNTSRMAVFAHSFGSKVLTTAMNKVKDPKNQDEACYAPLGKHTYFLTINAAIESAAFKDKFDENYKGSTPLCPLPNWINMTSKDDWVTKYIYPAGSALFGISTFKDAFQKSSWTTIGHDMRYITHTFELEDYDHSEDFHKKPTIYKPYYAPSTNIRGDAKLNQLPITHLSEFLNFFRVNTKDSLGVEQCVSRPVIFARNQKDTKAIFLLSYQKTKQANQAKIWNILTDKSVIRYRKSTTFINLSLHSAFSQTNPMRLFDSIVFHERLLKQYPMSVKPYNDKKMQEDFLPLINEKDKFKQQLATCHSED